MFESLATSNTFSFIELPALLSEANIWRFQESFPEHKEIIDTYWKRKHVINVNKVLSRDAGVLLNIIEHCPNLKQVTFSRPEKTSKNFKQLPAAIIRHCPALEVLDIPGIPLSDEDLSSLSTLASLKSLNINCASITNIRELLDRVFLNNQQLENVGIYRVQSGPLSFKNLSKSIAKLELEIIESRHLDDFFENIDKWQLEKLSLLRVFLSRKEIISLSNLTTLKSLRLSTYAGNDVIGTLFSNNPNLEDVKIQVFRSREPLNLALRYLPKTIKHFTPCSWPLLEFNILTECVKTWKLVSLHLKQLTYDTNLPNLVAATPSLENLSLNCILKESTALSTIQKFKQLKTLRLSYVNETLQAPLTEIMTSCIKLEVLDLEYANLSRDLLDAIANLPVLKEIILKNCFYQTDFIYIYFMQQLSKRNTLKTARFQNCKGFNNEAALTLIRECKTLTRLWIESLHITSVLVQDTVRELNQQKTRKEALYLTLILEDDMTSQDLHPKLELTTFSSREINDTTFFDSFY